MSRPKPVLAVRPNGCRRREVDLSWDKVRRGVQAASGAWAGWTSFHRRGGRGARRGVFDSARCCRFLSVAGPQARSWSGGLAEAPWCDKFPRGSYEMQSWRGRSRICKHTFSLLDSGMTKCCLGMGTSTTLRTLGLVHELLVLARQAHKLATVP